MLPLIEVRIWDSYRIGQIDDYHLVSAIFPKSYAPKDIKQRAHLYLVRNREILRIGEAQIVKEITLPLGRVSLIDWSFHLGGGDEDDYIRNAQKRYTELKGFDRFSMVKVFRLKMLCLDDNFLKLQMLL